MGAGTLGTVDGPGLPAQVKATATAGGDAYAAGRDLNMAGREVNLHEGLGTKRLPLAVSGVVEVIALPCSRSPPRSASLNASDRYKVCSVILVTGATGRVGYRLMEALADARADVTAMVRVQAKAADLPGTPRHVVATFDHPPPAEVLRGFDRVFLLSPAIEEQAELETVFIDALVAAGHGPHVVKIAADGFADPGCDVRFMLSHRQVALHLDATGLPTTYLAPALYLEDLLAAADTIREQAVLALPAGHGRVGFVAAGDVAKVAARVLTSPGHEGATYVLTGPEALRFKDVAARISAVFAREVDYQDQPAERARKLMLASGLSPWQADGNLELFDWIRQGGADTVTAAVREVTGAGPRPVQDWLDESRASFLLPTPGLPRSLF